MYFHSMTPTLHGCRHPRHLNIDMKRRSLTTIDVADRHEVDASFIAEKYKKRRISMAPLFDSCQTKLSTSQRRIQPMEERGHSLLLLSRHLSLSYLLLYASLLLQMSWGSVLAIDRL